MALVVRKLLLLLAVSVASLSFHVNATNAVAKERAEEESSGHDDDSNYNENVRGGGHQEERELQTCDSFLVARQVLLEFQGFPDRLTEDEISLIQDGYVRTFNVLANSECSASSGSRGLFETIMQLNDYVAVEGTTSTVEQSFTLLGAATMFCTGCVSRDTLFGDSLTDDEDCACGGPSISGFNSRFQTLVNDLLGSGSLPSITSLVSTSELETVDCPADRSSFNSTVVLDLAGEDAATNAQNQVESLETVVLRSLLNLFRLNTQLCDPFFRRITSIQINPAFSFSRRRFLQQGTGAFTNRLASDSRDLQLDGGASAAPSLVPSAAPSACLEDLQSIRDRRRLQLDGSFAGVSPAASPVASPVTLTDASQSEQAPIGAPTSLLPTICQASTSPVPSQSGAPSAAPTTFSLGDAFGTGFASLLVTVIGDCRGCANNDFLANDVSGRRERRLGLLAEDSRSGDKQEARGYLHGSRKLTDTTDACVCPTTAQRRSPTGEELQTEVNDEVQADAELNYDVLEAFEVYEINCVADVSIFFSYVNITMYMTSAEIKNRPRRFLEGAFRDAYNEVAEDFCDSLFRTVESVDLFDIYYVNGTETDQGLAEYIIEFRPRVQSRGGTEADGIFDPAQRRLERDDPARSGRRLEVEDRCFCPTNSLGYSGQSMNDFRVVYDRIIQATIDRGALTDIFLELPQPTGQPSSVPTVFPTIAADETLEFNDDCRDAHRIPFLTSFSGSTIEADFDDVPECGDPPLISVSPGVWYVVAGTGDPMRVSTCNTNTNFDTQIAVYEGRCRELVCVDANNDSCGEQSMVSWVSEFRKDYYVFVHGFGFATGNFEISLLDGLGNDLCEGAIDLPLDGSVTAGTTVGATLDDVGQCGSLVFITAPGVWYTVDGNGSPMFATTCDELTNFDTQISVFRGNCRTGIFCVDGNDQSTHCGDKSLVAWQSTEGERYFILVHGFVSATGDFGLVFDADGVENDLCQDAIDLQEADSDFGSAVGTTVGATFDDVGDCGSEVSNTSPGVWYRIVGNGDAMILSTCDPTTSFDTQISVFSGSCEELNCIDGIDNGQGDGCATTSLIGFVSSVGEDYYVLVHGRGSEIGEFGITVSPGVPNDLCRDAVNATVAPTQGILFVGTTTGSTYDNVLPCGQDVLSIGRGVWYFVRGFGSPITVSTCRDETTFNTQISVYTGGCESELRQCVDGNDQRCGDQSEIEWFGEVGEMYHVLVHGAAFEVGDFELEVSVAALPSASPSTEPSIAPSDVPSVSPSNSPSDLPSSMPSVAPSNVPSVSPSHRPSKQPSLSPSDAPSSEPTYTPVVNDYCENAIVLPQSTTVVAGTAIRATFDGVPDCGDGVVNSGAGVWYLAYGSGFPMVASTCGGPAEFDTQISVYEGSCTILDCIDGNDQQCGDQSLVAWQSGAGTQYLILVHGLGDATGDFELTIDYEGITNDLCDNALSLSLGVSALGTTVGATVDFVDDCGDGVSNTSPGVWYTVTGTGTAFTASTCGDYTDFNSQISVFSGGCGSRVCIDGNNDACWTSSEVTWFAEDGALYHILVHGFYGFGADRGQFELVVSAAPIPSAIPSVSPSRSPSDTPSDMPSSLPSDSPSISPSTKPSLFPSDAPSRVPSVSPSLQPSSSPSEAPSAAPSDAPSQSPSSLPSVSHSAFPSSSPSDDPSVSPSDAPSRSPSSLPSVSHSASPSSSPSDDPSVSPSDAPSLTPSSLPSVSHSRLPSLSPSGDPSVAPSDAPSLAPSSLPSVSSLPSDSPSEVPSGNPSVSHSLAPSEVPSMAPSAFCNLSFEFLGQFALASFYYGISNPCDRDMTLDSAALNFTDLGSLQYIYIARINVLASASASPAILGPSDWTTDGDRTLPAGISKRVRFDFDSGILCSTDFEGTFFFQTNGAATLVSPELSEEANFLCNTHSPSGSPSNVPSDVPSTAPSEFCLPVLTAITQTTNNYIEFDITNSCTVDMRIHSMSLYVDPINNYLDSVIYGPGPIFSTSLGPGNVNITSEDWITPLRTAKSGRTGTLKLVFPNSTFCGTTFTGSITFEYLSGAVVGSVEFPEPLLNMCVEAEPNYCELTITFAQHELATRFEYEITNDLCGTDMTIDYMEVIFDEVFTSIDFIWLRSDNILANPLPYAAFGVVVDDWVTAGTRVIGMNETVSFSIEFGGAACTQVFEAYVSFSGTGYIGIGEMPTPTIESPDCTSVCDFGVGFVEQPSAYIFAYAITNDACAMNMTIDFMEIFFTASFASLDIIGLGSVNILANPVPYLTSDGGTVVVDDRVSGASLVIGVNETLNIAFVFESMACTTAFSAHIEFSGAVRRGVAVTPEPQIEAPECIPQ